MQTDIRMMLEGLRPVADFREHVERTIALLEDLSAYSSSPWGEEIPELLAFWTRVLEGMGS